MHRIMMIGFFVFYSNVASDNISESVCDHSESYSPTKVVQSSFEICQALLDVDLPSFIKRVAYSLSNFRRDGDAPAYRRFVETILKTAGLKTKTALLGGCNLAARTDKAHFIFEFTVNKTPQQALERVESYKSDFFYRDREVFFVGIDFQYAISAEQFRCNWIAQLYSESGTLKESLPGERIVYTKNQQMQQVNPKRESYRNSYAVSAKLGGGGFGDVYKCVEKKSGKIFAAKFIPVPPGSGERRASAHEEIEVMNRLRHPKLLSLHDAFESEDEIVLIMEFLHGENLYRRKTNFPYIESEAEVVSYVRQICEAIKHMHERNIIHLDIRPENVVCQTKFGRDVKLIDFGLARKLDERDVKMKVSLGASEYAAPEILEHQRLGFHTDMWSLGVVAYFLLSGYYPFSGEDDFKVKENAKACIWTFDEYFFQNNSDVAKDFIRRLLIKNKKKRMSAHECLNHPWLKGKL